MSIAIVKKFLQAVFAMVMKTLFENKVPIDKVVGICSDEANTM
jgi:hypothetical protein